MELKFNIGFGIENEIARLYGTVHEISEELQNVYAGNRDWTFYIDAYNDEHDEKIFQVDYSRIDNETKI